MSENLITPKKSPREAFCDWCKSWSPQVKQAVIAGVILIFLTVFGWVFLNKKNVPNVVNDAKMTATNVSGSAIVQGIGNAVTVDNSIHYRESYVIPSLPHIIVETLDGLPPECTNNPHLRLNRLMVRNTGEAPIEHFCSRLQFPEAITLTVETNTTIGAVIGWHPIIDKIIVKGTGGKTESGLWIGPTSVLAFVDHPMAFFPKYAKGQLGATSRAGDFTGVWELTIDKLPPSGYVSFFFFTSKGPEGMNYYELASGQVLKNNPNIPMTLETNELCFFLEGEYQFQAESKPGKQHFIVPISYNSEQRIVSSLPIQATNEPYRTITLSFQ